jgi:hypothetical protein
MNPRGPLKFPRLGEPEPVIDVRGAKSRYRFIRARDAVALILALEAHLDHGWDCIGYNPAPRGAYTALLTWLGE